ncbi:MAG: crystallin J1 [Planctomycetes bacterium]|nr:crystallin J1 [Planctomycetota bacterium]
MNKDHETRMLRARRSLEGLSVGDALGERFFSPYVREMCLGRRIVPDGIWKWTDDTAMALAIVDVLNHQGFIDQQSLADEFLRQYQKDPDRGYGPGQHRLMTELARGTEWSIGSRDLFNGSGSFGNGAAMRVAPIGAYFADDLGLVAKQAEASAEVTHAHPDGIAGAIAVSIAAAWAWNWNQSGRVEPRSQLFQSVLEWTPDSPTRKRIELAQTIPLDEWEFTASNELGDGSEITSCDTVPFCLWVAAAHLDNFEEALWCAIRVHGDIDTNCAIIGGIVALAVEDGVKVVNG